MQLPSAAELRGEPPSLDLAFDNDFGFGAFPADSDPVTRRALRSKPCIVVPVTRTGVPRP